MVATTESPERSGSRASASGAIAIRTVTRCTTLVKLPVALSGGSSENCAPEAGETDSTTPGTTPPVERIDRDVDLLSGADRVELGLLEIGVDVGRLHRHDRQQPRARHRVLADHRRLVADDAVERRADFGEREIAFGLGLGGDEFAAHALGLGLLGLEHLGGVLGAGERGDGGGLGGERRGERRGGAGAVGGRLFEALLRAESDVGEFLRTVEFERGALFVGDGAFRLGVGRGDLGRGLVDRRVLRLDLPAEAGDRRVLGGDLGFGGVDREAVVAVVDARQQVAGANLLVFGDRDFDDVAGDLGGDDRGVGADIGVVGRDEEAPLDEPVVAPIGAVAERGQGDERQDEAPRRARAAGGGGRSAPGRRLGRVAAQGRDLSRFAHRRERAGLARRRAGERSGLGLVLRHGLRPKLLTEPFGRF